MSKSLFQTDRRNMHKSDSGNTMNREECEHEHTLPFTNAG